MKVFSFAVLSGLIALAAASPQGSGTTDVASSTSTTPLSPTASCVLACGTDVTCQAACVGVPAPDASMVNSTTACAAKCPQGDGSASDTAAYAKCQQACISSLFFTSTGVSGAAATGGSSGTGASAVTTGGSASGTGASEGGSATGSGSGSGSASGTASAKAGTSSSSSGLAPQATLAAQGLLGAAGIAAVFLL